MVFLDTNVPMYLIGAAHPNKTIAASILQRLAVKGERLVTDAEVFQEIVHRYSAIGRREAIQPAFDLLESIVEEVHSIDLSIVRSAKAILFGHPQLSSRDAVHVAVLQATGLTSIVSFDSGFDSVAGIHRIST